MSKALFLYLSIQKSGGYEVEKGISKGRVKFSLNVEGVKYSEVFEQHFNNAKVRGLAKATLDTYLYHHNHFIDFVGEDVLCHEITLQKIEEYMTYLAKVRKISATSINSYIRNISPAIKNGMQKGLIDEFKIPSVKVQETFKEIFTQEELSKLLRKPSKNNFVIMRTWAMIWVFATTGNTCKRTRAIKSKECKFNRQSNFNNSYEK